MACGDVNSESKAILQAPRLPKRRRVLETVPQPWTFLRRRGGARVFLPPVASSPKFARCCHRSRALYPCTSSLYVCDLVAVLVAVRKRVGPGCLTALGAFSFPTDQDRGSLSARGRYQETIEEWCRGPAPTLCALAGLASPVGLEGGASVGSGLRIQIAGLKSPIPFSLIFEVDLP